MKKIALAVHGGAGTLVKGMMTPEKESLYKAVLKSALHKGYLLLESGISAVEAVEASVKELEDSHLFNAGKGSVFTSEGKHEMDASIMDGKTLNAGAVSLVSGIKNPISLARDVMEKSDHVFLASKGAMQFAEKLKYHLEDEKYFYDELRFQQWQEIKGTKDFKLDHSVKKDAKFGTVGAVACDSFGNLAAATSTGVIVR
jgi:beta-aspartyl-peptidase (threonine type)